jgi:hypothetical protein
MSLSWGHVWWGRELIRRKGLRVIGRAFGGWGLQLSLGVWHCWFVIFPGRR